MKNAGRWLIVTAGLGTIWYFTRAVVVQFFGIIAFFVAAFEASVQQMTKVAENAATEAPVKRQLPKRLAADRAYRESEDAQMLIDLRDEATVS
jgi:hypothetical protein